MFSVNSSRRGSYHHGDLRNALAHAATGLAARGGPDAVTIRGAAREVGVTPTAAYRHFENQADLLAAARDLAMDGMLATIAADLDGLPTPDDPIERSLHRLSSAGRGYIRFALDQPGTFRTCFTGRLDDPDTDTPEPITAAPYLLLGEILDELVELGYLSPADRPGAEAGPWAAVHGLAALMVDGPLKNLAEPERDAAIEQTLNLVVRGLATGPNAVRRTSGIGRQKG